LLINLDQILALGFSLQ